MRKSLFFQIPFRKPTKILHDVVTCFSPLFMNERWQLLILALEVYRYYGASMQNFYITSIISEVYKLLKVKRLYLLLIYGIEKEKNRTGYCNLHPVHIFA